MFKRNPITESVEDMMYKLCQEDNTGVLMEQCIIMSKESPMHDVLKDGDVDAVKSC